MNLAVPSSGAHRDTEAAPSSDVHRDTAVSSVSSAVQTDPVAGSFVLPSLQVDMAKLSVPNPTPTSTTTTDTSIDQNVGFGKPLALEYSGAGKSVAYYERNPIFSSFKKVYKKGLLHTPTTYIAAFAALGSDVLNFLVDGQVEPALFRSLAEFKLYIERDTQLAIDQHPRRHETVFKRGRGVFEGSFFDEFPIPSLAEVCQSLLERISSFIKDKKVKDKGIKLRFNDLKRILSPGNDGTFPHLNELWSSTDGDNSDTGEDTDQDTNTNGDTDRVVADRRARHVCKLYKSLGLVFNVTEWADSEENEGISIIKKRYDGSGCGTVLQEARHQRMREDMLPKIQHDWKHMYDEELDLTNPLTLVVGPDKYIPASYRPNDTDENVSQEHIESAEARWAAMYQQSNEKRKQEQGDEYNELFELSDESSSTAFFSIEDYEESTVRYLLMIMLDYLFVLISSSLPTIHPQVSDTIALHMQYDSNIDKFHDETPLSISRLQHFQSQTRNKLNYTTLIGEVMKALKWMKREFGIDLELCQVIVFTPEQYTKDPWQLISHMVDKFYTYLSPDDTCRFMFCMCKLSERLLHGSEHYDGNKDHTKHGVETNGKKYKGPADIHNLEKKREEMRKCLVVHRGLHDMRNPSHRSFKLPLSRYMQLVERAPGSEHRTGEQVVTSKQVMGLFIDYVSYGGLRVNTKLTSRSINAMLIHHTGLSWPECTNQPRYYWDDAANKDADVRKTIRLSVFNSILSGLAKRLSGKCANPNCRNPDMVNKPTMGLSGDGDWEHDLGKDAGVSSLIQKHPIHTLNEIMRWCAVTCTICHGRKTWLNNLEFLGRVFDVERVKLKEMFDAELAKLQYCVEIP